MKEVHIACAGAGKTYSIATKIFEMFQTCPQEKKIYAITYTNYAVAQIKKELIEKFKYIPSNIEVGTIHNFLLNNIIYPFSKFVKSEEINSCSIEKLSDDYRWSSKRKSELKRHGEIHSSAVSQYAKSLLCKQTNDNKRIIKRKQIALQYLTSDIYCLFVDEAQDMDKDFFDLMSILVKDIDNFCFVGDPNQDLWMRNAYPQFISTVEELYGIVPIYKLESRRIPQNIANLCNNILNASNRITSINKENGIIEYLKFSELNAIEKKYLSQNDIFSMIKGGDDIFSTKEESKGVLPFEFKELIVDKYHNYDKDAIIDLATQEISQKGLDQFLKGYGLSINYVLRAKIKEQFSKVKNNMIMVNSIHKLKGLEDSNVYFIICNSLLEILLGVKNSHNKETNLLYVALTRTKLRLLFIILDDDNMHKNFKSKNIDIDVELRKLGINHAQKSDWFYNTQKSNG